MSGELPRGLLERANLQLGVSNQRYDGQKYMGIGPPDETIATPGKIVDHALHVASFPGKVKNIGVK